MIDTAKCVTSRKEKALASEVIKPWGDGKVGLSAIVKKHWPTRYRPDSLKQLSIAVNVLRKRGFTYKATLDFFKRHVEAHDWQYELLMQELDNLNY